MNDNQNLGGAPLAAPSGSPREFFATAIAYERTHRKPSPPKKPLRIYLNRYKDMNQLIRVNHLLNAAVIWALRGNLTKARELRNLAKQEGNDQTE